MVLLIEIVVFVAILALDLVTKAVVAGSMAFGESKVGIEGLFNITYVKNEGAAFSLFKGAGARWFFVIFGLIVVGVMIYFIIKRRKKDKFLTIVLSIAAAGILGNIIDRIFFGYVRDFIEITFVDFAIFNIADIAVVVGMILLIFAIFVSLDFFDKKKKDEKKLGPTPDTVNDKSDEENRNLDNEEKL